MAGDLTVWMEKVVNNERELSIDELDAVSGGGTNGGTVVAG
jgi:bacteriocin-like protein